MEPSVSCASELADIMAHDGYMRAPAVIWDGVGRRALTLDWSEGMALSDPASLDQPGLDRPALATNLIVQVLPVVDQQRLHSDLADVHRLIVSQAVLTPEHTLPPGSPVEIIDGPFAGMHGKLLSHGSGCRLFIEVKFLQRGVSVAMEPWMVRGLGAGQASPR